MNRGWRQYTSKPPARAITPALKVGPIKRGWRRSTVCCLLQNDIKGPEGRPEKRGWNAGFREIPPKVAVRGPEG